jgi:hypothetical protein
MIMNEKVENVKKNKTAYFAGAGSLAVGVLGTLAFTQRVAISQQAQNIQLLNWKPFSYIHQTFVHVPARGNRGIVVVHDQTGKPYGSIKQAAEELGLSRSSIQQQLKGLRDSVNGQTFTSPGENLTEKVKIPA